MIVFISGKNSKLAIKEKKAPEAITFHFDFFNASLYKFKQV